MMMLIQAKTAETFAAPGRLPALRQLQCRSHLRGFVIRNTNKHFFGLQARR
jgi:hypothetical protein